MCTVSNGSVNAPTITLAKEPTRNSLMTEFQLVYQAESKSRLIQHKYRIEAPHLVAWADT